MSRKSLSMSIAHVVRIVSVPPVMVAILILLLFTLRDDVFASTAEMLVLGMDRGDMDWRNIVNPKHKLNH